ncbi:hypothetical protein N431DRAFT_544052 [Stipitochalara longipes BDJ]|nr:hypothetical protein N431DRAFT_544052 [Stipitochalara longipes BDJ]
MQLPVGAVVFCPMISALIFSAPQATPDVIELRPQGWNLRPTDPPTFNTELLKRQLTSSLTQIEGPDLYCGYQFGLQDGALGLCSTSTCGFATGLDQYGEIYCYGPTTSTSRPLWTSCLAGTLAISCLADSACSNNPGIALCMDATYAYCNVGTFIGLGVEAVWCDSTYYADGITVPIYTTFIGQTGRVFTNPTNSMTAPTTTTSRTPIVSTHTTPTTTSTQTTITPTTPIPQSNSTPVGPIVGGVIGGLALIAAIAAGIFFCLRQKRRNKQTTNALEYQTYTHTSNTHSQQPSDKYPATAEAAFIPAGYPPNSATPGPQIHYQQPPQPQYQQPLPAVQPSYNSYPIAQQQTPRPTGNYMEQQQPIQQLVQQTQQQPPHNFQAQPRPQPLSSSVDAHRGSVGSPISTPGSPAPPSYASRIPVVPEMTGVTGHHASPIDDRFEMPL